MRRKVSKQFLNLLGEVLQHMNHIGIELMSGQHVIKVDCCVDLGLLIVYRKSCMLF